MKRCLCALALAMAGSAGAENAADWKEGPVPNAPAFSQDQWVTFVVSANSELTHGIDPKTVSLGTDGVIRYVMIASNRSGALNAVYEGLHCDRAEVRTYARWTPGNPGQWRVLDDAQWKSLFNNFATRAAFQLARSGFCAGATPNGTPVDMVKALRLGPGR